MHPCPLCGKQTHGTTTEGGITWDICLECFEEEIGAFRDEPELKIWSDFDEDNYEGDPEELGAEYEQWLDANGL